MANGEPPITSGARDRLLEQVLATLAEKYIFPDVAARIATEIRTGSRRALYHYPVARPVRPALGRTACRTSPKPRPYQDDGVDRASKARVQAGQPRGHNDPDVQRALARESASAPGVQPHAHDRTPRGRAKRPAAERAPLALTTEPAK